eukprot:Nk52_evm37s239 gene=Nk52_evmTU37s239
MGIMRVSLLLLVVITTSGLFDKCIAGDGGKQVTSSPPIRVKLQANWTTTPTVLEASEAVAAYGNDKFWKFVEGTLKAHRCANDEEEYGLVRKVFVDNISLDPLLVDFVELSLAIRVNSPHIQTFQHLAEERLVDFEKQGLSTCGDGQGFADVHGQLACSADELEAALKGKGKDYMPPPVSLFDFDHIYPIPKKADDKKKILTVFVYDQLGSTSFEFFHLRMKNLMDIGLESFNIRYVLRHYYRNAGNNIISSSKKNDKMLLSGYGVELQVKSSEYKAMDESNEPKIENMGNPSANQLIDETVAGLDFQKLKEKFKGNDDELYDVRMGILNSGMPSEVYSPTEKERKLLGMKMSLHILNTSEPLLFLRDVSQNLPNQWKGLTELKLESFGVSNGKEESENESGGKIKKGKKGKLTYKNFRSEVEKNRQSLRQVGVDVLFVNGVPVQGAKFSVFETIDILSQHNVLLMKIKNLGLEIPESAILPLIKAISSDQKSGEEESSVIIDLRPPKSSKGQKSPLLYYNDLEKDSFYRSWPKSLQALFSGGYPGGLKQIGLNMVTGVVFIDPCSELARDVFLTLTQMISRGMPMRIGFVFNTLFKSDVSSVPELYYRGKYLGDIVAKAFGYIYATGTKKSAFDFLSSFHTHSADGVTAKSIKAALKGKSVLKDFSFNDFVDHEESEPKFDFVSQSNSYVSDLGLDECTGRCMFVNGVKVEIVEGGPALEQTVLFEVRKHTYGVTKDIYEGKLPFMEPVDFDEYFLGRPSAIKRWNQILLDNDPSFIDLSLQGSREEEKTKSLEDCSKAEITSRVVSSMNHLYPKDEELEMKPLSVWVVCDILDSSCRNLMIEYLEFLMGGKSKHTRLGFIPVIRKLNEDHLEEGSFVSMPTKILLNLLSHEDASAVALHTYMKHLDKLDQDNAFFAKSRESHEREISKYIEVLTEPIVQLLGDNAKGFFNYASLSSVNDLLKLHNAFASRIIENSMPAIVCNGRLFSGEDVLYFGSLDFELLEKNEFAMHTGQYAEVVQDLTLDGLSKSEMIMKLVSTFSLNSQEFQFYELPYVSSKLSVIKVPPKSPSDFHHSLFAIVDPLSKATQKLSAFLLAMSKAINAEVTVVLLPEEEVTELPHNRFYRLVLFPEMFFDNKGNLASDSLKEGRFARVPVNPVFTLGMETSPPWMVEAVRSKADLDNIKLSSSAEGVDALFQLQYIVIEGQCVDTANGAPPRGLQFDLGPASGRHMFDTIVMANLGYFQLKAKPGIWFLSLREGKSSHIYEIVEYEGSVKNLFVDENGHLLCAQATDFYACDKTSADIGGTELSSIQVELSKYTGKFLTVKVKKQAGKEHLNLVSEQGESEETEEEKSMWSSVSEYMGASKNQKTIHVFSIASGHLYERFLRIMMLSVLKNTESKVKFWFLKTCLSPVFSEFIPHMAEKYGFDYELVEYKWPNWLHAQTEKQRIIWAYKILFLDVLFPLNLERVIFVDADQIVRSDLQELMDMDLEGAPYGYTPFCDSRTEMEGFRFWKSGYWSSHLMGKPYHISALYVVDLKTFRLTAAGDRLRGQYHQLSQDPTSLSNLDQDLPNNMIHELPIFSLPQDWLWCETWCSDESKKSAKTIDLCNNPQTKEPKLVAAKRIVPEWTEYDSELTALFDEHEKGAVKDKVKNSAHREKQQDEL